jgi:hypothetical protein
MVKSDLVSLIKTKKLVEEAKKQVNKLEDLQGAEQASFIHARGVGLAGVFMTSALLRTAFAACVETKY